MFPLLEGNITSQDCIDFLKSREAILVGGQGLTALEEAQPDIFPIGKWTTSFDEKDALYKDVDGRHRVPDVRRNSAGAREFSLGSFVNTWHSDSILVCFCDIEKS